MNIYFFRLDTHIHKAICFCLCAWYLFVFVRLHKVCVSILWICFNIINLFRGHILKYIYTNFVWMFICYKLVAAIWIWRVNNILINAWENELVRRHHPQEYDSKFDSCWRFRIDKWILIICLCIQIELIYIIFIPLYIYILLYLSFCVVIKLHYCCMINAVDLQREWEREIDRDG